MQDVSGKLHLPLYIYIFKCCQLSERYKVCALEDTQKILVVLDGIVAKVLEKLEGK